MLDRFVLLSQRPSGEVLYDLARGKGAALGPTRYSPVLDHRAPGLLTCTRGGEQVVVNLAAIR